MASQWQNFLRNVGEWRGTFTTINREGVPIDSTASLLSLQQASGGDGADGMERLVRFRLRRYANGPDQPPSRDVQQDYRSLGRQVVFFNTGAFAKGSLQVAPATAFGAEFGFVGTDRRHRLVQLFDATGTFDGLVLIREFRSGTAAAERPALSGDQLFGDWQGEACTLSADWPELESSECSVRIEADPTGPLQLHTRIGAETDWQRSPRGVVRLLPDGGFSMVPERVSHRAAFSVESGWLSGPDHLERLIRTYDASGAWRSASHLVLRRCCRG
jgi:hypothetical protein